LRTLLRAAAYRSSDGADGRRPPSSDEDAFTTAATAIEWTLAGIPPGASPLGIDLLGEFPTSMEWALPAVVGAPVHLLRSTGSARGITDALRRATEEGDGLALVVAVDIPTDSALPTMSSAAAVAFLLGDSERSGLSRWFEGVPSEGSAVEAGFSLYRARRPGNRDPTWVGNWEAAVGPGPASERPASAARAERSTEGVSQGAYVPRARYLENLSSRWRFVAERCPVCGFLTFPARGKCRSCGHGEGLVPVELPRDGALVVATTVIGSGGQPTEFDPQVEAYGPYEVVLAQLAPGARVTLQLTDAVPGQVRIGDRVDTRLRCLYAMEGEWRYGRKAVPRPPALPVPT
jgi:uncharacterized OB-fold protein